MRIAVYDRYWPTAGGGEKFAAGVAHVLADDHEVTMLAHEPVDTAWLGERLAVDLSKVSVEQVGEAHRVEAASAGHDLLINLSFKSSDRNGARHGLYVVHFPHDRFDRIPPRQQRWLRTAAPLIRAGRRWSGPAVMIGAGFHDPDVLRLSQVRWSDGAGEIHVTLPPGQSATVHLGFGPLLPAGHDLPVTIEVDGREVGGGRVSSITSRRDLIVPRWIAASVTGSPDGSPVTLTVRSDTWVPHDALGNDDHRHLGVPLVGVAVGRSPVGWATATASLFEAFPPPLDFLATYDRVLANSRFTRHWIRRWWGHDADVLYPPVTLRPPAPKRPIVLSVGRYFAAERGHSKKQIEMVEAWRRVLADPASAAIVEREGWVLHLVGGCSAADRPYVDAVRAAAAGLPVEVHVDASGAELDRLYREASVYWHAAGLDEDEVAHPDRMEHFGITTVEAMSAGAVPVAFAAAGPLEAFTDGIEGFHFGTLDELVAATGRLLSDPERRATMSTAAQARAEQFGLEAFGRRVRAVVEAVTRD